MRPSMLFDLPGAPGIRVPAECVCSGYCIGLKVLHASAISLMSLSCNVGFRGRLTTSLWMLSVTGKEPPSVCSNAGCLCGGMG